MDAWPRPGRDRVGAGDEVEVDLELATAPREVTVPGGIRQLRGSE